jgi:hypothetical protein
MIHYSERGTSFGKLLLPASAQGLSLSGFNGISISRACMDGLAAGTTSIGKCHATAG